MATTPPSPPWKEILAPHAPTLTANAIEFAASIEEHDFASARRELTLARRTFKCALNTYYTPTNPYKLYYPTFLAILVIILRFLASYLHGPLPSITHSDGLLFSFSILDGILLLIAAIPHAPTKVRKMLACAPLLSTASLMVNTHRAVKGEHSPMSILAVLCGVAAGLVVTAMPWFELPKKPDMSGVLERVFLKELLKGGEMDTEQRQVDREVEAEVKKRRRGGVMVDGVFRKRTSPPSLKLGLGSKWNSAKKEL